MRSGASYNPESPEAVPVLMLEGLVLEKGKRLESLPPESRNVLSSGLSLTFLLWSTPASWFMPDLRHGLVTTPGISSNDAYFAPSDASVRFLDIYC